MVILLKARKVFQRNVLQQLDHSFVFPYLMNYTVPKYGVMRLVFTSTHSL